MPIDLPPTQAPYAYVVDVRPFDGGCVVPHCAIKGRSVVGYTNKVELDGDVGAYATHGRGDNEMFFRRAVVLRKGESYAFDVPEETAASELDFYLSAVLAGPFHAQMRVTGHRKASAEEILLERSFEGVTDTFVPRTTNAETGKIERFEQHARVALPSRDGRMLHVVITNDGATPLALGSPLVMKRALGREPRQAFVVVFDAAPFYILERLFTGTHDGPTEFFHRMTSERGVFFPHGFSPAVSTQIFVRRFFRHGYYRNEGEPVLRGFDMDEQPPERAPTTIARFAEQGFLTEHFVANFVLNGDVSANGADGGYQNETIGTWPTFYHPRAIASRFDRWLQDHSHDDAFAVVWMSTTHDAVRLKIWSPSRPQVFAPAPPGTGDKKEYAADRVEARWENLIDSADAVRDIFQSASRYSPSARRLWFITADHGLIESNASLERATRYRDTLVGIGPQHRFFGSTEESWTPFGLLYDGSARPPRGPMTASDKTMAGAAWRAYEQLFDVNLGVPETSSWDSPAVSPEAFQTRWADDGAFSVGHAGAIRCAVGKWGYRSRQPKLWLWPLWDQPAQVQLMLGGNDRPNGFVGEELYDDELDPLETKNLARAHTDVVLAMRRRTQDFYATYSDPASHPRYRHVLTFAAPLDLVLEGPRAFKLRVDGTEVAMTNPRRASVRGKKIELIDDAEPLGIVSVKGPEITAPLLLRCGASGLPLDELGPARDRFDLTIARHNCVVASEGSPPRGEVWFSSELVRSKTTGATSTGGASAQALEAFRRWGYVRDLDKKP